MKTLTHTPQRDNRCSRAQQQKCQRPPASAGAKLSYPYFSDARDDDGALLHRRLQLLLGRLVELPDGGFGHGVGAVEHQQLGVGGGEGLADHGAHHGRLLGNAALRQLGLDGRGFLRSICGGDMSFPLYLNRKGCDNSVVWKMLLLQEKLFH